MAAAVDASFFARLIDAGERFRHGLPATLDRLGAAAAAFDPALPAPQLVAELQASLHTLAGAAITFGLHGLGQGARALEQRLRVLTVFATVGARDWAVWIADVGAFVTLHAPADGDA